MLEKLGFVLLFDVENPSQPRANAIKLQALKHQIRITKEDGLLCYSGLDEQIHEFNFSEDLSQQIEMQLFDLEYKDDLSKDFGNGIKK